MLLTTFFVIESRSRQPLLPLHLFAERARWGSYAVMLMGGAVVGLQIAGIPQSSWKFSAALVGILGVRRPWALALVLAFWLLNPVFYSFYANTAHHPRFLYASLPELFVLWAAGLAVRRTASQRPSSASSTASASRPSGTPTPIRNSPRSAVAASRLVASTDFGVNRMSTANTDGSGILVAPSGMDATTVCFWPTSTT